MVELNDSELDASRNEGLSGNDALNVEMSNVMRRWSINVSLESLSMRRCESLDAMMTQKVELVEQTKFSSTPSKSLNNDDQTLYHISAIDSFIVSFHNNKTTQIE